MRIGIISDTHGYFDPEVTNYFKDCDEIWHAGDVGDPIVIEHLRRIAPVHCVYGNIDEGPSRPQLWPEIKWIQHQGVRIMMMHIVGKPLKYLPRVKSLIKRESPTILVAGHSHILKVQYDTENRLLFINPGAAGHHGFHKIRTIIRFEILNGKPQNMEVIELGLRGRN